MELRHLRYFVAVAEEGSLTNAAERRLHTAQPSLSRQIRDLELEVGVKLLERGARGIELTAAGRTFLDHARLALLQVEAAGDAARRAAQPEKAVFVVGFLTGAEVVWLPEVLRILREEQPGIEITLSSQSSPDLAGALMRGKVDVAFLRRETQAPGLTFKFLIKEPLVENLSSAMSLVASTGGVTLLPLYAQNLLSSSVVIRLLQGQPPTIDLVMGYSKSNTSPLLKRLLSRADELVARVSQKLSPKTL